MKILKKKTYFWAPIEYNQFKSLVYMTSRSVAEYSVLVNILNEIKIRDKKFDPNTVFDFGSGMGSVLWYNLSINCFIQKFYQKIVIN